MTNFLDSESEHPKTFRTAVSVADLVQGLLCLFLVSTPHDEVVGLSDHFKPLSGHLPVHSVEVDIG
jgi:hypothetical protein